MHQVCQRGGLKTAVTWGFLSWAACPLRCGLRKERDLGRPLTESPAPSPLSLVLVARLEAVEARCKGMPQEK